MDWVPGGKPFRVVAALEMLASLFGVLAFWPEGPGLDGAAVLGGTGITDNRGNSYIIARMMTTKFPLCAVLMELTEQLSARDRWLRLAWAPRQQNEEADALTNACFEGFDPERRVHLDPAAIQWTVMSGMMKAGGGLVEELVRLKMEKRALKLHSKEMKRRRKRRLDATHLSRREPW